MRLLANCFFSRKKVGPSFDGPFSFIAGPGLSDAAAGVGATGVVEEQGIFSLDFGDRDGLIVVVVFHGEDVSGGRGGSGCEFGAFSRVGPGDGEVPDVVGQRIEAVAAAGALDDEFAAVAYEARAGLPVELVGAVGERGFVFHEHGTGVAAAIQVVGLDEHVIAGIDVENFQNRIAGVPLDPRVVELLGLVIGAIGLGRAAALQNVAVLGAIDAVPAHFPVIAAVADVEGLLHNGHIEFGGDDVDRTL